eukprot:TRINITY_DN6152_c0_g1_i1.p1 TRINITY_DN6152_c0_g1~~TRINITY_DN6152_c0_g1_i1.p1  ORF type:complete len:738 (+),score=316.57 TRINITY_DN6152_c0_g1_i1:246-2216(+)
MSISSSRGSEYGRQSKRRKIGELPNLTTFHSVVSKKPENFATSYHSKPMTPLLRKTLKVMFDYAVASCPKKYSSLPELIMDGFDLEQVWQQIQLQDDPLVRSVTRRMTRFVEKSDGVNMPFTDVIEEEERRKEEAEREEEEEDEESEDEEEVEEDDEDADDDDELMKFSTDGYVDEDDLNERDDDEEDEDDDEDDDDDDESGFLGEEGEGHEGVNDTFFDMDEMERFLDDEDEREAQGDDEDGDEEGGDGSDDDDADEEDVVIGKGWDGASDDEDDVGDDGEEDEEESDIGFDDFFDAPPKRKKKRVNRSSGNTSDDGAFDEQDEKDESLMSAHEKRQQNLQRLLVEQEKQNVGQKAWPMRGEISAKHRPRGSLLEVDLDYDQASKARPAITEETTLSIEETIKRRIIEESWDDVVRKREEDFVKRKKKKVDDISEEKSKLGLAELYEKDYMEEIHGVEEESAESKQHQEIVGLFRKICHSLDSLANFGFTPRLPKSGEDNANTNLPAITMEEVTPAAVSEATLQTPQEVFKKKAKEVKGESEVTQEEKKVRRRHKKRSQRKREKQKKADAKLVDKLNLGMGNKYSKEKALKELQQSGNKNVTVVKASDHTNYTSASTFFSKLEDEARAEKNAIKKKIADEGKKGGERSKSATLKL